MKIEKVEYTDCYVALVDILGFKDFVCEKSCKEVYKMFKDIFDYSGIFLNNPTEHFKPEMLKKIKVNIISDSIVFSVPKNTERSLEILIFTVSLVAFNLLHVHNLTCRGGISLGGFYMEPSEKNTLYGPAVVSAYLLEHDHAKNPRIIFENELLANYIAEHECDNTDETNVSDEIRILIDKDYDDYYFVDYIGFFVRLYNNEINKGKSPESIEAMLQSISNFISQMLNKNLDEKTLSKYIYLKKYYNNSIDLTGDDLPMMIKCRPIF